MTCPHSSPCSRREVRSYYSDRGALGPISDAVGVIVCTFEKANALVCRLLEEEALDSLGRGGVGARPMARCLACLHPAVLSHALLLVISALNLQCRYLYIVLQL